MIIVKTTGQVFENRKQAKQHLGHSNFNRLVKNNELEFTNEVSVHSNTDIIY